MVQPAYRSTPWQEASFGSDGSPRAAARVALVSESGICRGPLAAAAVAAALARRGLSEQVECECRATQSYCVGEEAHPAAAAVAVELGLPLPDGYAVQQFKEARDIVDFDVVSSLVLLPMHGCWVRVRSSLMLWGSMSGVVGAPGNAVHTSVHHRSTHVRAQHRVAHPVWLAAGAGA